MSSNNEEKDSLINNEAKIENNNTNTLNQEGADNNAQKSTTEVQAKNESGDSKNIAQKSLELVQNTVSSFFKAGLFEFFGMFLFTIAILLGSGPEAAIISFWIIITMIFPYSGGHINPAVTFGLFIYEMNFLALGKLFMYTLSQMGGCLLAIWFSTYLKDPEKIVMFKKPVETRQIISEGFFTGTFIFVILYCLSKKTRVSDNRALNCGIIASWLYYASTSAGKISVGALNPAIMSAFAIFNTNLDQYYYLSHKSDIWRTILTHFGSALVFALFFYLVEYMFPDQPGADKEEKKQDQDKIEIADK